MRPVRNRTLVFIIAIFTVLAFFRSSSTPAVASKLFHAPSKVLPEVLPEVAKNDIPSYADIYSLAREYFSYESPLPTWPVPKESSKRFSKLLAPFPWKVDNQIRSWQKFIVEGSFLKNTRLCYRTATECSPILTGFFFSVRSNILNRKR